MRHVLPLVGKVGCNNRMCHGSFRGQNGFRLSLFGSDPLADHKALVEDQGGKGARVDRKNPSQSLMLLKPTQGVPHVGGFLFDDYAADLPDGFWIGVGYLAVLAGALKVWMFAQARRGR